jgi:hypothetical protein
VFGPAIAACGFREPLAPRLARPGTGSLAAVQSQPVKLGADDPYVRRGYGLRDVHRRYAEVTTSEEVLAYLADLAVPA